MIKGREKFQTDLYDNGHLLSGIILHENSDSGRRFDNDKYVYTSHTKRLQNVEDEREVDKHYGYLDEAIYDKRRVLSSKSLNEEHRNRFLPSSSSSQSLLYSSGQRSPERTKWLAYAKGRRNSSSERKIFSKLPRRVSDSGSQCSLHDTSFNSSTRDVYSPRPASVQSDFIQNLYHKYPHSFNRRCHSSLSVDRPSRRMFSSGLRVRFKDEVDYDDETRSVQSERLSRWDSEMSKLFGQQYKRNIRQCLTSPTPSMASDSTLKQNSRENLNLESVRKDYSEINCMDQEYFLGNVYHDESDISNDTDMEYYNSHSTLKPPNYKLIDRSSCNLEEKENMETLSHEDFRNDFQYHMYVDKPDHFQNFCSINGPDSPPDSAIDIDISPVQSTPSCDPYNTQATEIAADIKDSDVDSGISQEPNVQDKPRFLRPSSENMNDRTSYGYVPRPMSVTPRLGPYHADIGLPFSSSTDSEEEDSIMRELAPPHMRDFLMHNQCEMISDDEFDDSDPRYGSILSASVEDRKIQERYRSRRNPSPFVIKSTIHSMRYRPHSAPIWKKSVSESNVSTLCTPRNIVPPYERSQSVIGNHRDVSDNFWEQSGVRDLSKERGKMSDSSTDSVSTLHKSQEMCFIQGENSPSEDQNLLSHEIEEEIRQQQKKYVSSDEEETTYINQRDATPVNIQENVQEDFIRSIHERAVSSANSLDDCMQEEISKEFPKIADHSSKLKFHFNPFKSKKGRYFPTEITTLNHRFSSSCTSLLSSVDNDGKLESRRFHSESNLLDEDEEITVTQAKSEECIIESHDHFMLSDKKNTNLDKTKTNSLRSILKKSTKNYPSYNEQNSNNKKDYDENIEGHLNPVQSIFQGRSIRKDDNNRVLVLNEDDIKQLDEFYELSDDMTSDENDIGDDNDDDDEDNDEEESSSQAVYPAELEMAAQESIKHTDNFSKQLRFATENSLTPSASHSDTNPQKSRSVSPYLNKPELESVRQMALVDEELKSQKAVTTSPTKSVSKHAPTEGEHTVHNRNINSKKNNSCPVENLVLDTSTVNSTTMQRLSPTNGRKESSSHVYADVTYTNNKESPPCSEHHLGQSTHPSPRITSSHGDISGLVDEESITGERKGKPLNREFSFSEPNIATITDEISLHSNNKDIHTLPNTHNKGDSSLTRSKEMSASKMSLGKVGNFKAAAKAKFKSLRKAVSKDKGLDKEPKAKTKSKHPPGSDKEGVITKEEPQASKPPKPKKSGISLKNIFKKKGSKHRSTDTTDHGLTSTVPVRTSDMLIHDGNHSNKPIRMADSQTPVGHTKPKLLEVNPDGTQSIQLTRPQEGPIGLYIAKGNSQFKHGTFVSRFSEDKDPKHDFAGLIDVGDEILEINGYITMDMNLNDLYDLMAQQTTIQMKILPLLARKDV